MEATKRIQTKLWGVFWSHHVHRIHEMEKSSRMTNLPRASLRLQAICLLVRLGHSLESIWKENVCGHMNSKWRYKLEEIWAVCESRLLGRGSTGLLFWSPFVIVAYQPTHNFRWNWPISQSDGRWQRHKRMPYKAIYRVIWIRMRMTSRRSGKSRKEQKNRQWIFHV